MPPAPRPAQGGLGVGLGGVFDEPEAEGGRGVCARGVGGGVGGDGEGDLAVEGGPPLGAGFLRRRGEAFGGIEAAVAIEVEAQHVEPRRAGRLLQPDGHGGCLARAEPERPRRARPPSARAPRWPPWGSSGATRTHRRAGGQGGGDGLGLGSGARSRRLRGRSMASRDGWAGGSGIPRRGRAVG
jgi:hypothetical protein